MMKRFTLFVFLFLICCLMGCDAAEEHVSAVSSYTNDLCVDLVSISSTEEVASDYLADNKVLPDEKIESTEKESNMDAELVIENVEGTTETADNNSEIIVDTEVPEEENTNAIEENVIVPDEVPSIQPEESVTPMIPTETETNNTAPTESIQQPEQNVAPAPEVNDWDHGYWFDEQLEAELLGAIQTAYPHLQNHPYLHDGAREYASAHEHNHSGVIAYYGASGNMQTDFATLNNDYPDTFAYSNWQYVGVAVYHENGSLVIFIVFS